MRRTIPVRPERAGGKKRQPCAISCVHRARRNNRWQCSMSVLVWPLARRKNVIGWQPSSSSHNKNLYAPPFASNDANGGGHKTPSQKGMRACNISAYRQSLFRLSQVLSNPIHENPLIIFKTLKPMVTRCLTGERDGQPSQSPRKSLLPFKAYQQEKGSLM